jgi:copper resistance protein D
VTYTTELKNQRFHARTAVALFLVLIMCLFHSPGWSQQHDMSNMDGMPGMSHSKITRNIHHHDAVQSRIPTADTQGSEFNHHLAGLILFLAGIILLAEERLAKFWPPSRYVWPVCFLTTGLFVLVFSDAEIWPLGPQTPWYALSHSVEDLQHKSFAIILLSLGYVELQRARGRFKGLWSALFFPIVAISGAILLLFHVHGGDMSAPNAMQTMEHIESQHRWFAAAGLGIAVTKGLAEIPQKWQLACKRTWPALLTVLGTLLMVYTE